jgi:hypothetical protein
MGRHTMGMCLDWCTFFGDRVGPIGTVFFTYVFILISNSIPTFEKNRAKSALVSDLPKTSNNNIKTFFHPRIEFYFSLKNKIIQFEIHFISLRLGAPGRQHVALQADLCPRPPMWHLARGCDELRCRAHGTWPLRPLPSSQSGLLCWACSEASPNEATQNMTCL